MMNQVILPNVINKHIAHNLELNNIRCIDSEWNKKYKTFLELVDRNSMEIVESVKIEDRCGILLFTYSGSLILISPILKNRRWLEYSGINNRKDTPHIISEDKIKLLNDIITDRIVYFDAPIIKNTSPIYKIAVY